MHTVLWPGCEWKNISMGDVIISTNVKKIYTTAIRMFHPDKVQGLKDPHKIYIADRVFNALNDAYNEFRVIFIPSIITSYRSQNHNHNDLAYFNLIEKWVACE